jgi:molybdopterin/thiamine biosynthesis adenylyltransferase
VQVRDALVGARTHASLAERSALVIGAGGLGGPALLSLAASGVGKLWVCDFDVVESSNLNRQPLFGEGDIGSRKALTAVSRLRAVAPGVRVEPVDRRFDGASAAELIQLAGVIIDGSDNFPTKFLVADAAFAAGRPLVHGGLLRYTAQILTVVPGEGPCLRCLFEAPPPAGEIPTCAAAGVLGALAGLAGGLMAAEALRLLGGERASYLGSLLIYDAREALARQVIIRRRPDCAGCSRPALEATA